MTAPASDPAPQASPDPLNERIWEEGWNGHEQAQRRRLASLTLAQKLQWLEDMQRIVDHLHRSRAARDTPLQPPTPETELEGKP
jgi:hypothetical protein